MDGAKTSRRLRFDLNGESRDVDVDNRLLLVQVIREVCGKTGTHVGCMTGDCGACTVRVDGAVMKSCLMLAASADGKSIETIEGVGRDGELHPMQEAFWEKHGFQCGFCVPGMLLCALDLLEENPDPTDAEIRQSISGNLCRCTGYEHIVEAIRAGAEALREERTGNEA